MVVSMGEIAIAIVGLEWIESPIKIDDLNTGKDIFSSEKEPAYVPHVISV